MKSENVLFSPFTLPNGATLKNRLLMAPMTTCTGFYDGTITEDTLDYYEARAGGIGAIIVESCYFEKRGAAFPGALGIDTDDCIEGLAKIARVIKGKGSKAILQIHHGGRMIEPKLIAGEIPVAPSAIRAQRDAMVEPKELSHEEIENFIYHFGQAVLRSIKAGYDGVEIHGANTFLIQQFFSPNSNQRNDKWGGDREKRIQFALSILATTKRIVKQFAKPDFIIGYRFSPEELEVPGIRFEDTIFLLEQLADRGLDYLHFSMGYILRPSICDINDKQPLIDKYCQMRSPILAKIPVIGVGNIVNQTDAQLALQHGYDLVAVGRACIAYPDWVEKIQQEQNLTLVIDQQDRTRLKIPAPLWNFPSVKAMVCDTGLFAKKFKPGLYQESVSDGIESLTLSTTLDIDKIIDISLDNFNANNSDIEQNFTEMRSRIVTANTPHVDAVTGATTQCELMKKAVFKAVNKSIKAALKQDGISLADTLEYDVVVVGSGGAGLAAAIQAHDCGAHVLLVEKMSNIGGNTVKASVGMNAAETRFQAEKGIVDSKEIFFDDSLRAGHYKNNEDLLHYFVDNANLAIDWLVDHQIELSDITITGGMTVERTHRPADGSSVGSYLVKGLMSNLTKRNIDIMLDTSVEEIVLENNCVTAIKVRSEENDVFTIKTQAVIVATGGFSANKSMVKEYRADLEHFVTTNHGGATGSGIKLLTQIGATVIDMEKIQIHPTVEQQTSYLISESIRGGGAILISQQGVRFVNEMETRDKVSKAILDLPESYAYIIFDEQIRTKNKAVEEYLKQGFVKKAESIEALAQMLDINTINLQASLARYNGFVENQHDEDFGRKTALRSTLSRPPFYGIQIAPGVHHTMGGVVVNTETCVLDSQRRPIDGVYAVGEVVGGIHGYNRIGGNAIADIVIFGIQAGKQAAFFAKK